jgi:hypothetical protein
MGILSKILGAKKKSRLASYADAVEIVCDFGALIEARPPLPTGMVADVNELPHSKDDIKKALLIVLLSIDDETKKRELSEAYSLLAYWQPGIGKKRVEVNLKDAPSGSDKDEVLEFSRRFMERYEKWKKWEPIVEREYTELVHDLTKLQIR